MREAVRTRAFVGLYAACLIASFGAFVPFVHLVPYALDHGIPPSAAVLLLSMIGVGSTAGRFFLGGLADRFKTCEEAERFVINLAKAWIDVNAQPR